MNKSVYIKTEPGGKVCFGRMSDHDLDLLDKSRASQQLSKDIAYKVKKGLPPYRLIVGVINSGTNGGLGNEGVIEISEDGVELPRDCDGNYVPGTYVAYFALSKVSIEFNVRDKSKKEYDPNKLVEESVVIDLPSFVKHGVYSNLKFNLVTGYRYNGKKIRNANKCIVDRGYEESISIFRICENKAIPLYEMVDDVEKFF